MTYYARSGVTSNKSCFPINYVWSHRGMEEVGATVFLPFSAVWFNNLFRQLIYFVSFCMIWWILPHLPPTFCLEINSGHNLNQCFTLSIKRNQQWPFPTLLPCMTCFGWKCSCQLSNLTVIVNWDHSNIISCQVQKHYPLGSLFKISDIAITFWLAAVLLQASFACQSEILVIFYCRLLGMNQKFCSMLRGWILGKLRAFFQPHSFTLDFLLQRK